MNIMVTGGAGYIGSHAVRLLLRRGYRVVVVDNLSHGHNAAVDDGADFYNCDIGDSEKIEQILREHEIDAVVHFAAFIEVGESVSKPAKYYENNVGKGLSLLSAMAKAGVKRLVFSSTAAVYGNPNYSPIDECHPLKPINPYGFSKFVMEQVLSDYAAAYGLTYVAFRYFNVAGAADDQSIGEAHIPETHLIPRILAVAMGQGDHVKIFGTDYPTPDGTCIRDYVHVEDLVSAHVDALEKIRTQNGKFIYNLGSQSGFSVYEVIEACRKVTGHAIPSMSFERRAGDPPILIASSDKVKAELGWTLKFPEIEKIVESAWKWHLEHPNGFT